MIVVAAILMALGIGAYLGYPIVRRDRSYAPDQVDELTRLEELISEKDKVLRAIKDLEFDVASAKLSPEDYTSMRSQYERRAVAVLREIDGQEAALRRRKQVVTPAKPSVPGPVRASSRLWARPVFTLAVIGLLILIVGAGGFLLGRVAQEEPSGAMAREGSQDNAPQMVTALEARVQQNPRDVEALVGLGRIYLQTGQMPKAIEVYRRALEVDGNNVSALSGMAMILAQAGHSEQALTLLDKALAINPQVPMALLFKGRILYEDKKDYAAAIVSWEQFLKLVPQGRPAEVVRGWIDEARREVHKSEGDAQPSKMP
jgi:cytochrome c-type biogenesis protein CcmH/NrfG